MTVFDMSAVRRLEADTESPPFVRSLVDTYQEMLTPRVERIVEAVLSSDSEAAIDAALSLRVSSIMIGATELSDLSTAVLDDLKNNDLPSARAQALLLAPATERARERIAELFALEASEASEASEAEAQAPTDSIR